MTDDAFMPKWSPTTSVQNLSLMSQGKNELYWFNLDYPYVAMSLRHHYDVIKANFGTDIYRFEFYIPSMIPVSILGVIS